jgi:uncharacterized protein YqeY
LAEAAVIDALLPKTPTEDDVVKYIQDHYANGIDKKQMGMVIKEVKSSLLGVDGAIVANIVKTKLV